MSRFRILVVLTMSLLSSSCTILRYQRDSIHTYVEAKKAERKTEERKKLLYKRHADALVDSGEVEMGFTKKRVLDAYGKPDFRQGMRIQGTYKYVSVWSYIERKECLVFVNNKLSGRENMLDAAVKKR